MYTREELTLKRAEAVTAMIAYKDVRGDIGELEAIVLTNTLHLGINIGIGIGEKSAEEKIPAAPAEKKEE